MKSLVIIVGCLMTLGCHPGGSTVSPIQAAGCDVETAILGGASTAIGTALSCGNVSAIQASLTTALGNANLCATPIPQAPASAASKAAGSPAYKTIGDVPLSALKSSAVKSDAVRSLGIVGNIACPIAINTVIGFLSNSVPAAWSCSSGSTAASLEATLVQVCQIAVPI